jgi:hypothetical protein
MIGWFGNGAKQPDPAGVQEIAACGNCGCQAFVIKIYSYGFHRAHCGRCNMAWARWPYGSRLDESVAQQKPWQPLKISKATWYRRKKEATAKEM